MAGRRAAPEDEGNEKPKGKTVSVKYIGPAGQMNYEVAEALEGEAVEEGKSYELPEDLAERLIASSPHWEAD
jgi:hypothetical protein